MSNRLFKRGAAQGLRFIAILSLSVILMVMDHREAYVGSIRTTLSAVVAPVRYLVDWPVGMVDWLVKSFSTHQEVLSENAKLRAQQLLLQAKLQKALTLEKENKQLRALLQSSPRATNHVLVARLLAVETEPFIQQVVLNKGAKDGVYAGQAVLDANGVMGQVVDVGSMTSRVLLITATRSAVPIRDTRNGVRAIVAGLGEIDRLSILNVADTTDIKVGDVLVTSGLGQRFPAGYPVGVVHSVVHKPGERFATIHLKPSAHINRSRLVLLVWPDEEAGRHASNSSRTAI